jgi:lipoate-protein ligase B
VWVAGGQDNLPPAKIASIGVRVDANRITRHGFALNVAPDMTYWKGMIACGLENQAKTSMANLMPKPTSVQQVTPQVIDRFSEVFNARLKVGVLPEIPGLNWHRKV